MNVLIAYATAHGSTAEVAHAIGRVLLENDMQVAVKDIRTVNELEKYDAFIFGSAIHSGAWIPDLTLFIKNNLHLIGTKPVYFFITCIRVMEHNGFEHVMENYMMPDVMSKLNVQDKTAFAGKLVLEETDWNERWSLAARYDGAVWPSNMNGDFRDWERIRAWGTTVAENLRLVTSVK